MTANNIRPSSRKAGRRRSQRLASIAVVAACLLTAIGVGVGVRNSRHARPALAEEQAQGDAMVAGATRVSDAYRTTRAVYRHSVVRGGVFSQDEVRNAVANDAVVAAHYAPVVIADARVERVTSPRQAYMSYRIGDKVYWTKHKMTLQPGETIVTDGTSEIRARCGNRISDLAMEPTLDNEPGSGEFDAASVPGDPAEPTEVAGDPLGLPVDVNEQALASPDPDVLGKPEADVEELPALIAAAPFAGGGRVMARRSNGTTGGDTGTAGDNGGDRPGDKAEETTGDEPKGPNGGPDGGPDGPGNNPPGPGRPGGPGDEGPPRLPPGDPNTPVSVPEPGSLLLVGTGLAAYAIRRRRARANAEPKAEQ